MRKEIEKKVSLHIITQHKNVHQDFNSAEDIIIKICYIFCNIFSKKKCLIFSLHYRML